MKRISLVVLAGFCGSITSNAWAAPEISVKFENKSSFAIHHLYLSPTKEKEWGPDQLGDKGSDTIEEGDAFTLNKITPSVYDLKLVDEDGDECEVGGIKIKENEKVVLTNELLVGCQAATAEEEDDITAEE